MSARTLPFRAAYSNATGFSGSVTGTTVVEMCSGKASIGSMTDEKCRSTSRFYTFQTRCRSLKGSKEIIDCSMVPSWDGEATRVEGKSETGVEKLNMSTKSL
ncbi:UNVERIFIED_CONTAM: hypothetical protein NCL1_53663 [Trichonephila clavipes]